MRKKEVIWVSRDQTGLYLHWYSKPQWRRSSKEYTGTDYISASASNDLLYTNIILKKGGLAKITIERQY